MRDEDLMEEKIELLLPRRQVVLLAVAALVLLGAVFALGVLVGRSLASAALAAPHAAPADTLPALDAAAAREPREEPPGARPAAHVPSPVPAPAPEVPVAAASPAVPAAKPAAAQPAHPAPVASADDEPDPVPEDDAAKAQKGLVVVPAPPKAVLVPAPKSAPRAASTMPLPPPPKELGQFTVQLGASQDRGDAQRLEARARSAGLRPYLVEADLGARGLWYRVRVGAFETRDAADGYRKDVERELRLSAVVMSSR